MDDLEMTNTSVVEKPNYQTLGHQLIAWLASVLMWGVGKDFNNYWTTLGRVIYTSGPLDPTDPFDKSLLSHEIAHRYDDMRGGWWGYKLPYVLCWSERARLEMRGYGIQMVSYYRETGQILDPRDLAETITGPAYLWAGNYEYVLEQLKRIASAIKKGELDIHSNDPRILEDVADV